MVNIENIKFNFFIIYYILYLIKYKLKYVFNSNMNIISNISIFNYLLNNYIQTINIQKNFNYFNSEKDFFSFYLFGLVMTKS